MTDKISAVSCGFAASVPGAGHIRYATPCQDASGTVLAPRPAAIVCDGRGSAKLSHLGAQGAVRAFFSQISVLEPFLAGVLDRDAPPDKWTELCRLLYRTLLQVKLDLAAERGGEEKDYDFTVAFAVAGSVSIGCFQVGDGAIVLRQGGVCQTAFAPDKGEFANQTQFLRPGGDAAGKFHAKLFSAEGNEGVAITSDGPEHLMFRLPDMEPGPIFGKLLDDLAAGELCEQDLRDYLTRTVWNDDPRGSDDRSIAVLLPVVKSELDVRSELDGIPSIQEENIVESESAMESEHHAGGEEVEDAVHECGARQMEPADVPPDHESLETTKCRNVCCKTIMSVLPVASVLVVLLLIAIGLWSSQRNLTDPCKKNLAVPEKSQRGQEIGLSAMEGFDRFRRDAAAERIGSSAEGWTSEISVVQGLYGIGVHSIRKTKKEQK